MLTAAALAVSGGDRHRVRPVLRDRLDRQLVLAQGRVLHNGDRLHGAALRRLDDPAHCGNGLHFH